MFERAIAQLNDSSEICENNAPIHAAEGRLKQAECSKENAESYRAAIGQLLYLEKARADVGKGNIPAALAEAAEAADGIIGAYSAPVPGMKLADGFGDAVALFNSRGWLQSALEAKGAKVVGGGCGLGQADLDIELEGFKFNVSICPL